MYFNFLLDPWILDILIIYQRIYPYQNKLIIVTYGDIHVADRIQVSETFFTKNYNFH